MKTPITSALLALALLVSLASPQPASGDSEKAPRVSATSAPKGTEGLRAKWVKVEAPGLGVMLAAVARPPGRGPFPAIILLHGSHGFAQQYVQLAQDLARGGVIAVAPCWFAGGGGAGSRFITPIACAGAPAMPEASTPEALRTVHALVQATRTLRGVRPDRIALFGHSRGGGATLNYVLGGGDVQAAVLDSTGYPRELTSRVSQLDTPILILHGMADSPDDGGGLVTDVQMARNFESALLRSGKIVEATYYEGGRHNSIFTSPSQHDDEVRRIVAFVQSHLGEARSE